MFESIEDIEEAGRDILVEYLENWGFAVYDDEGTELLRDAAIGCFEAEGDSLL